MLTLYDTALEDKYAIWIIKINLDADGYLYFADCEDKITLSGIDFDGKVILQDSLSSIVKDIDVVNGGSIGQVGNAQMGIARYTSYVGVSNFQNDFYPATSKPLLTSKTVEIGLLWTGATTTDEITWIEQYYVEHYFYNDSQMLLSLIAYDELTATQIPPYVVQKDYDNGIGYYTDAPDESYGEVIPLVYGDFSSLNLSLLSFDLSPTIKVAKAHIYKSNSEKCDLDDTNYLYKYIELVQGLIKVTGSSPSYLNNETGYSTTLTSGRGKKIIGDFYFHPQGWLDGGSDFGNAIDDDIATYANINANDIMKVQLGTKLSEEDCGETTGVYEDAAFIIEWDANGGNVDFQVKYYHPNMGVNSGYSSYVASGSSSGSGNVITYYFGNGNYDYGSNPKKYDDTAAWSWEELSVLEFRILNLVTSVGSMRIKNIYFKFSNQKIYEVRERNRGRQVTRDSGERILPGRKSIIETINAINNNPIFSKLKGCEYDAWID